MKIKLYSIRDKKASMYNVPVTFDNDAVAIRAFGDLVTNDKQSLISLHPSDFCLVGLGDFDRETGDFFPVPAIVLADGDNFVKE